MRGARAAETPGISYKTLLTKIKEYGIWRAAAPAGRFEIQGKGTKEVVTFKNRR
jgi:hypothetical protein